jgi:hypothetical protein
VERIVRRVKTTIQLALHILSLTLYSKIKLSINGKFISIL